MMLDAGKPAAAVARGSHMQAHRARGRRIRHQLRLLDGARELRTRMWGLKTGARLLLRLSLGMAMKMQPGSLIGEQIRAHYLYRRTGTKPPPPPLLPPQGETRSALTCHSRRLPV